MTDSTQPFATMKFIEIKGQRMAYIDEGEGAPIVFQHGNPTSSYLWRNVMPACRGLGRLIACDLIGMGDSAKLPHSGPDPLYLRRAARVSLRPLGRDQARQ
jgi:haloalkane dehalogenase